MSVKTLEIDGRMITGLSGETIFSVAWEHGIRIPRLCHIGGISNVGACRLCMVEVEGQRKLQTACLTPVEEGMKVHTDTPKLQAHRKLIVELLLAERSRPAALPVSVAAGGYQPRALRHRPQPLHPVHALRAGLRRSGGRAHLGCFRARRRIACHYRSGRALGQVGHVHRLRQVRAGMSHRSAVRQGAHGG